MTLSRPRLAQHPTGSTFGNALLTTDKLHPLSPTRRVQKFPDVASFKVAMFNA